VVRELEGAGLRRPPSKKDYKEEGRETGGEGEEGRDGRGTEGRRILIFWLHLK